MLLHVRRPGYRRRFDWAPRFGQAGLRVWGWHWLVLSWLLLLALSGGAAAQDAASTDLEEQPPKLELVCHVEKGEKAGSWVYAPLELLPAEVAQHVGPHAYDTRGACETPRAPWKMRKAILTGPLVSMGEADTQGSLFAQVSVEAPFIDYDRPVWLTVALAFQPLPGQSLSLVDPTTFNSVDVGVGGIWKPWNSARFSIGLRVGFATRLPNDPEPLDRTARYGLFVLRVADQEGNWLELTGGADQRLDSDYQPTAGVEGALKLWADEDDAGKETFGIRLYGRALLDLDFSARTPAGAAERNDVVQIGAVVSR